MVLREGLMKSRIVKSKLIIRFLLLLLSSSLLNAQVSKVGTTSAGFLKIGVGSRATAMGESFVALSNDATAAYWNPAGLAQMESNQALFGHTEWLADISIDNVAIAVPLSRNIGTFGIWANSISVPEDEVRTVFQPEGTGEMFGAGMLSLGLSYGRFLTDRFSLGFTTKYIRESIWSMSAAGMAIDVGTLYRSQFHNMKIGIALSNFGTKLKMSGRANLLYVDPDPSLDGNNDQIRAELEMEKWDMPLLLRAGFALDVFESSFSRLTVTGNSNHPNDNKEYLNFGAEYTLADMVYLRGGFRGIGLDKSEGGLTLGGGLDISVGGAAHLLIDYAYTDWGRLNNVKWFTLSSLF